MADKYITKVYLLNVPLENDYKNTLYFTSKEAQQEYFQSRIVTSKGRKLMFDNFSYQRKDSFIRVPSHFDDLQGVNYAMYQNSAYSNKWFYAFITDIKYVDDGRTDIVIETDYMQTWFFDYNVKESFVEREHVNNDGYYQNLIDEGLPYGDYQNSYISNFTGFGTSHPVMSTTVDPNDGSTNVGGGTYGGVFCGSNYYIFQSDGHLKSAIERIASGGKSDGIVSIFMCPDWLSGYSTVTFNANGIAPVNKTTFPGIKF